MGAVPKASAGVSETLVPVTHADLYCAGFVTRETYSRDRYVLGGATTPNTTRFSRGEFVYLAGKGYQPGTRVSIIRELKDSNASMTYEGQSKLLRETGSLYAEVGYADVVEIRGDVAVAKLEFSCDSTVPGDQVVPFVEKQPVSVRTRTSVDQFPAAKPKLAGQLVAAQDLDQFVGAGQKVYFNLGSGKGVKPGDYFLLTRGYSRGDMDIADQASLRATVMEDTQRNPAPVTNAALQKAPRHVLGELVVLEVTPAGATGMITFATEEIHVGDVAEAE